MGNNSTDLNIKVRDWLKTQGYPLEMFVSKKLNDHNFSVYQSTYYKDPEQNIAREIDIIARKGISIKNEYRIEVIYVIECKLSSKKPWLIFTSKEEYPFDPIGETYNYFTNELGSYVILEIASKGEIQKLTPCYSAPRFGYGITDCFTTGTNSSYEASLSVTKASVFQLSKSEYNPYFKNCTFIFPIIVLDGIMFEAYMEDIEDIEIEEISTAFLKFNNKVFSNDNLNISIVTKSQFDDFANKMKVSTDWLLNYCKLNIARIEKEMIETKNELNI